MTAALTATQLTRRFGRTTAIDQIDLVVPTGSIFALLGPNGAGKSTCLKLWLNLLRPTAGEATLLGRSSRSLRAADFERIGYVAEGQDLPLWMTVDRFIAYCRAFYPRWDHALEKRLRDLFDLPGARQLKHLSRGMRMKAALLSTLSFRPEILLLDEPFSGLDPLVRDELVAALLELPGTDRPATVVISTHDLDDVQRLIDHVAFLHDGRLLLSESLDALTARHRAIEISAEQPLTPPTAPPGAAWQRIEQPFPRALRAIDTRWDPATSPTALRAAFPGAHIEDRPLSLRELFLLLARRVKTPSVR
ncbi:ABC transporter ATP-binding protein [Actomonas aquatica]|uniref:ABC transporter ATP-binding protein n=1 Tax=Actomonas aquatica TaxID=2866162 RepID=A0ABZ1C6Z8_9BACT|nr:ABC transporter ATP-binding protein [Opitutus sp. WL0086]WRQ87038.1 ABC transporter ATP-binding protein [Opitutus sp. WL0086]